jgi:hypothetical protein
MLMHAYDRVVHIYISQTVSRSPLKCIPVPEMAVPVAAQLQGSAGVRRTSSNLVISDQLCARIGNYKNTRCLAMLQISWPARS